MARFRSSPPAGSLKRMHTFAQRLNYAIRRAGWIVRATAGPAKKEEKGKTVSDLAQSIGADPSWLSRLLNEGRPQLVKVLEDVARLCQTLDVDFLWLAIGDEARAPGELKRRDSSPPASTDRPSASPHGRTK